MKITLLGDSIRMIGYGKKVVEMLGKDFEVFQPEENCRFAKYTLRGVMHEWEPFMKGSEIIHWNNGLWDVCELADDGPFTPYEVYEAEMLRVLRALKKHTNHIIFATTTPVLPSHERCANPLIEEYNAKIVPVLKANGVVINDLHSAIYPKLNEYIRADDRIHLTEAGIDVCANLVTKAILDEKAKIEAK